METAELRSSNLQTGLCRWPFTNWERAHCNCGACSDLCATSGKQQSIQSLREAVQPIPKCLCQRDAYGLHDGTQPTCHNLSQAMVPQVRPDNDLRQIPTLR